MPAPTLRVARNTISLATRHAQTHQKISILRRHGTPGAAHIRRYVNWTPSNDKRRPVAPNGDSLSPSELDRQFQPPSSSSSSSSSSAREEPQLLRLKNNKSFKQWESEWTERVWRGGQVTLILGVFMAAYAIGSGYVELPYGMNHHASKLPAPGSEEEEKYLKNVENALHSLPIVRKLSDDKEWIKAIGIFPIPEQDIPHNLTMGVLAGSGRISVKPVTFYNDKTKEFVVVMHVGQDICGHRGLVHGGFLATMLDECLGKTAITTLSKEYENGRRRQVWPEDRIIVTANLNINYRAPTKVNQFVVIKSILTEATDRKAKTKGRIETVDETPVILCEGEGLFVKPSKEALKKILGK